MSKLHDAIQSGTAGEIAGALATDFGTIGEYDTIITDIDAIAEAIVAARPEITASDYIAVGIDLQEKIETLETQLAAQEATVAADDEYLKMIDVVRWGSLARKGEMESRDACRQARQAAKDLEGTDDA